VDESWRDQVFYSKRVAVGKNHPVVGVNWNDANAFCAWLSKKEGRSYRLPTDREWSIAVGLGSPEKARKRTTPMMLSGKAKEVWSWGTVRPPPKGAGNFADTVCRQEFPNLSTIRDYTDGYATTAPVMSFKPNKNGLYDMGGNVQQ
jgi:formylglycine-generating enzyme required for sulfatase activity